MAYTVLVTKISTSTIDLTDWDAIRNNFIAGVPDNFSAKGDSFWATGADAGARLAAGADDSIIVFDASQPMGVATQIVPACRVYNNANISIPGSSSWATMTFNSERFDTDAMHSTSSNTSRLTVPSGGAGIYTIGGNVVVDSSALGVGFNVHLRLLLNGVTVIAQQNFSGAFGYAGDNALNINTIYSLAVADYVELQAMTDAGSAINALSSANQSPEMWAAWLRRQ